MHLKTYTTKPNDRARQSPNEMTEDASSQSPNELTEDANNRSPNEMSKDASIFANLQFFHMSCYFTF